MTVPLVAPGLGAGAALASSREHRADRDPHPGADRHPTLATEFWTSILRGEYGAAAPYALLLILVSLPATYVLGRQVAPGGRDERT